MSGAASRSPKLSGEVAGQGQRGEVVGHDRHFGLVHMFGAEHAALVRQVAGGAGVFDQGATETQVLGGAHGGADAGMAHETADDQVQGAEVFQALLQVGAMESAGQQFFNHGFVAQGFKARNELAALALWVEQPAMGAQVAHMHDWPPGGPGCAEQLPDVRDCRIHAAQGQGAGKVFFLGIDDDQRRLTQVGRCVTAAAELKHRFWNGHSGAPSSGAFATFSSGGAVL